MSESTGIPIEPEEIPSQSVHGEVIGTISSVPDPKSRKKGLEVSFINGQIVLDRSSLVKKWDEDGYI